MGIKLVVEVLDHYQGPDARKLWLLAWAEKASDDTRSGWPPRSLIAHRTGRSPSRVSHIADELVTEGVLKRDGGGNRSGPARFALLQLTTGKGAESAHSFREPKGAPRPHPKAGKSAPSPHPKPQIKGAESAGKGADPEPRPAKTGPSSLIYPSEEQNPSTAAQAPPKQRRGTRVPDDFAKSLTPGLVAWARRECPHVDGRRETERFMDYWQSKSGQGACKLDWIATWRNWMRTAEDRAPRNRASPNGQSPQGQVPIRDEWKYNRS